MKNHFTRLWMLSLLSGGLGGGLISGCATGNFSVDSDPAGADVSLVATTGNKTKLGQTPLSIPLAQQPELASGSAQLQITKTGFRTERIYIPAVSSGSVMRLQTKLTEDSVARSCQDYSNSISAATDTVAEAQRLIYKKNYAEAERVLSDANMKFPAVPVFHSLLGNVHYLRKNLEMALQEYQKASALQPQNSETMRMIQKIRSVRGDLPAGER